MSALSSISNFLQGAQPPCVFCGIRVVRGGWWRGVAYDLVVCTSEECLASLIHLLLDVLLDGGFGETRKYEAQQIEYVNDLVIGIARKKLRFKEEQERKAKLLARLPYEEYLKTTHWQSRREQAILYAGAKCQVCSGCHNLEVHHNDYSRLGQEWDSDLVVLCGDCHGLFHERKNP